jgi:hypothetical protein
MSTKPLITQKPMNLVLCIESDERTYGSLRLLSCNQTVGDFSFIMSKGIHTYSIRVSADSNYWEIITDAVVFETDTPVDILKMCLVSDDGEYFELVD